MPRRNRQYGANYRFGFNRQEKDNEIEGAVNLNIAMFGEYGARLGWNVDPIPQSQQSIFSVFSNNPIINMDPNGNTDYFNKHGNWIGTDGVNNGVRQMALMKSTVNIIKMGCKGTSTFAMNENVYKN